MPLKTILYEVKGKIFYAKNEQENLKGFCEENSIRLVHTIIKCLQ